MTFFRGFVCCVSLPRSTLPPPPPPLPCGELKMRENPTSDWKKKEEKSKALADATGGGMGKRSVWGSYVHSTWAVMPQIFLSFPSLGPTTMDLPRRGERKPAKYLTMMCTTQKMECIFPDIRHFLEKAFYKPAGGKLSISSAQWKHTEYAGNQKLPQIFFLKQTRTLHSPPLENCIHPSARFRTPVSSVHSTAPNFICWFRRPYVGRWEIK